jgi:Kelch motif
LAVVNGQLYAIGGADDGTTGLSTVEIYDRESWIIQECNLNEKHWYGAVGVIQHSIDDDDDTATQ